MGPTSVPDDPYMAATASLFGMTPDEFHDPTDAPDADVAIGDVDQRTGAASSGVGQIATRRTPFRAVPAPFSNRAWPELHRTIDIGTVQEVEAVARHPHPSARCIAAAHPQLWTDLQHELSHDEYREVRSSLLQNPMLANEVLDRLVDDPADSIRIDARSRRGTRTRLDPDRCVECGARVKNSEFRTCSVQCSISQTHRRVDSGLWADAIEVDYRHSTGLRADWPGPFQWRVAHARGSGGIPGAGPVMRIVLVPFVRHVLAVDIVDLCRRIRDAGLDQRRALATLARIGLTRTGPEALDATEVVLGLEST